MSENTSDTVSALIRLGNQAAHFVISSNGGVAQVRLGLITTLYFKDGHTAHLKRRIAECFSRFRKVFKHELKWQLHKSLFGLTDGNFDYRRKLVRTSSPDEQIVWAISSSTLQEVAEYRMFVMNTPQSQSEIDRSCLKMVLPWSFLLSPDGPQRYADWLQYLCDQLSPEHGFGGLACVLPHDGQRFFPLEQRLAQQHIGLMVDPMPQIESLRLLNHIKGANWYTVLGPRFVKQLGGNDALRRQLSGRRDVAFQAYHDGLIIRAGALPVLGGDAQDSLAAYGEVNRVIRPIRVQSGCLHPYPVPGGGGFCEVSSAQWYARFDDKPVPPLLSGQACTHDGYWFSSAVAGSRCVFRKGEVMPMLDRSSGRPTQWLWVKATD